MPIFEYTCNACGFQFEKLHRVENNEQVSCPSCSSVDVKKELSTFSSSAGSSSAPCSPGGSCAPGGG